jgi:hypothetical protein
VSSPLADKPNPPDRTDNDRAGGVADRADIADRAGRADRADRADIRQ